MGSGTRRTWRAVVALVGSSLVVLATALPAQPGRDGYVNESPEAHTFAPTTVLGPDRSTAGVPAPGSWSVEANLDRVVHIFDLPGTNDTVLACAGSGNLRDRHVARQWTCQRYDRTGGGLVSVALPDDWFCGSAVLDVNGNIVTCGGTSAYPEDNGGRWGGSDHTYRYVRGSGAIVRLGDMHVERWYGNKVRNRAGDIFEFGKASIERQTETGKPSRLRF